MGREGPWTLPPGQTVVGVWGWVQRKGGGVSRQEVITAPWFSRELRLTHTHMHVIHNVLTGQAPVSSPLQHSTVRKLFVSHSQRWPRLQRSPVPFSTTTGDPGPSRTMGLFSGSTTAFGSVFTVWRTNCECDQVHHKETFKYSCHVCLAKSSWQDLNGVEQSFLSNEHTRHF